MIGSILGALAAAVACENDGNFPVRPKRSQENQRARKAFPLRMRVVDRRSRRAGTQTKRGCRRAVVAVVDPVASGADFKRIEDVPLGSTMRPASVFPTRRNSDPPASFVSRETCAGRKTLVRFACRDSRADGLSRKNHAACYTAYNHRFEPHIARVKQVLDSGIWPNLFCEILLRQRHRARCPQLRLAGQGHGRPPIWVRTCSTWRISFSARKARRARYGARTDLRTRRPTTCSLVSRQAGAGNGGDLFSWRNTFGLDVIGELGSAHIDCLCKWGPAR